MKPSLGGYTLRALDALAHQKQRAYDTERRYRKRADEKLAFVVAALEHAHATGAPLAEIVAMVRVADSARGDVIHRKAREQSARDALHFTVSALRVKRNKAWSKRERSFLLGREESPYKLALVPDSWERSA